MIITYESLRLCVLGSIFRIGSTLSMPLITFSMSMSPLSLTLFLTSKSKIPSQHRQGMESSQACREGRADGRKEVKKEGGGGGGNTQGEEIMTGWLGRKYPETFLCEKVRKFEGEKRSWCF